MNNIKLEKKINNYLKLKNIKDNSINGLQIEGCKNINKIISCVTINLTIIKKCLKKKFNTIICHHGILWKKNKINIIGIRKKIIKKILLNNINLYCWHIPLDIHKYIGNNIILANKLKIKIKNKKNKNYNIIIGKSNKKIINIIKKINKNYIFIKSTKKKINKIAICTGLGEKYIEKSILKYNIDTYITGEVSEYNIILSKQYNINLIIIGHHFSEIYGIKYLGKWINKKFKLYVKFLNINKI